MQRRALQIPLQDARTAEPSEKQAAASAAAIEAAAAAVSARCTQQLAPLAAKKLRYLSYQEATSPYSVQTASRASATAVAVAAAGKQPVTR